jgi:hypothetical protein
MQEREKTNAVLRAGSYRDDVLKLMLMRKFIKLIGIMVGAWCVYEGRMMIYK